MEYVVNEDHEDAELSAHPRSFIGAHKETLAAKLTGFDSYKVGHGWTRLHV